MILQGIRVIEMGVWVAGPAVGGVMADWGAEVIKIEPPQGDPMRQATRVIAGFDRPSSPPFTLDNRGKRSVTIDLQKPAGGDVVRRLIHTADVFLTNYRLTALERLGLDYASLAQDAPRLIYAMVTGYGNTGPDRQRAGYDIGAFWARTGIAHLLALEGEPPTGSRSGFGDHITAMIALSGVMAALFQRERTGRGQYVEASLLRAGVYTIGWDIATQLEYGMVVPAMPRTAFGVPTVNCYRTSDGRWVQLLGVEAERHWPRLLRVLEREDLAADPRFATARERWEHAAVLIPILDAEFARRPLADWIERFDHADLWWAPSQTPAEVVQDPQALAAGAFVDIPAPDGQGGLKSVASPVTFGTCDTQPKTGPPRLGEHTEAVLRAAGFTSDELARLRTTGVLPYAAGNAGSYP
jgi:crotonobetainyl-CoA:carnitine CoA-transferase CaiB-like acyl-CoA transferase